MKQLNCNDLPLWARILLVQKASPQPVVLPRECGCGGGKREAQVGAAA